MPQQKPATSPAHKPAKSSPFRKVAPALPLAIALGYQAIAPKPPSPSPAAHSTATVTAAPAPLLAIGHPVNWWFAFKFNATTNPRPEDSKPTCIFGGTPGGERKYTDFGQDYAVASDEHPTLDDGKGYLGDSIQDPLGATFSQVYNGKLFYVVWNDQFYHDPALACEGSGNECGARWGHSKGLLAWDASGAGFVLQVSTPDWPGSATKTVSRQEGNSLGCLNVNNTQMSQHFFALKLTHEDVLKVLSALREEAAVTVDDEKDDAFVQIKNSGGPADIKEALTLLGSKNADATYTSDTLSSGVILLAKSGSLYVPPWQMVSSLLHGTPLRVASYWQGTLIYSTDGKARPTCYVDTLNDPGAVAVALTGTWHDKPIGLDGTGKKDSSGKSYGKNHAKLGVSTDSSSNLTIFGDMNQDGVLSSDTKKGCMPSQNQRGGMFFVMKNKPLHDSVAGLIQGKTAPLDGSQDAIQEKDQ